MKYRFRVSKKPFLPHDIRLPARRLRFRLKGADTLRARSRLPDPVEEIRFEFSEAEPPRTPKRRLPKKRATKLRAFLHTTRVALAAGISLVWHKTKQWVLHVCRPKKALGAHVLPVLSGALCAALVISVISAGGVLFGLFAEYSRSYESVTVPNFVGKEPALDEIGTSPFHVVVQYEKNDRVAEGLVISQSPPAGVRRRLYSSQDTCTLVLTVSQAEEKYTLENLAGMPQRDALLTLRNEGVLTRIKEEYSNTVPKGTVLSTLPVSGVSLTRGDTVVLRVSKGKQVLTGAVPSLIGMTEARAEALLRAASLTVGEVTYASSAQPAGTVISQSISAGSSVAHGSAVSYTVSAGNRYQLRTVPDLYGLTLAEAEQRLREYGLLTGNVYPVAGALGQGTVMTQSPLPDTPITSSTVTVDLYVIS